jgi:hypothetical protein
MTASTIIVARTSDLCLDAPYQIKTFTKGQEIKILGHAHFWGRKVFVVDDGSEELSLLSQSNMDFIQTPRGEA